MTPEQQIAKLTIEVERLTKALSVVIAEKKAAEKHLRDSYMGAVLSGLTVNWSWGHTKPERVAEFAELLVNAVMMRRKTCGTILGGKHEKVDRQADRHDA